MSELYDHVVLYIDGKLMKHGDWPFEDFGLRDAVIEGAAAMQRNWRYQPSLRPFRAECQKIEAACQAFCTFVQANPEDALQVLLDVLLETGVLFPVTKAKPTGNTSKDAGFEKQFQVAVAKQRDAAARFAMRWCYGATNVKASSQWEIGHNPDPHFTQTQFWHKLWLLFERIPAGAAKVGAHCQVPRRRHDPVQRNTQGVEYVNHEWPCIGREPPAEDGTEVEQPLPGPLSTTNIEVSPGGYP